MLAADARSRRAAGGARGARADRRAAAVAPAGDRGRLRSGDRVLRPRQRRDRARAPARGRAGAGQLARPAGPAARAAPRGAGARRAAGRIGGDRLGVRAGRVLVRGVDRDSVAMAPVPAQSIGPAFVARDLGAGLRYVRSNPWIWATLVSAAVAYLLFMGPTEVLLPFVVKHQLADGARDLGLIFAAGGLGSLACAVAIGQIGLPRRSIVLHVHHLDGRDPRRGRLRARAGTVGPDARQRAVQHARDRRHDRVGDGQATARPGVAAGQGVEPGLADLDRAAAGVLRAGGARQLSHRRAQHVDRCRCARCGRDVRAAADPVGAAGRCRAVRGRCARSARRGRPWSASA